MASMLTQAYEVSTPEEARAISDIGVDHIDVLVGNGEFPRELSIEAVGKVAAGIIPPSKFSALFLTFDLALVEEWARELQPAILHLGAAPELLSPNDAAAMKAKLHGMFIMRSIPVIGQVSIEIACSYEGIADFLLLDSHRESDRQIGALGVPHDWSISRRIVQAVRTPVILAGEVRPHLPVVYSERADGYSANAVAVWFLTRFREIGVEGASSHSGRRTFITAAAKKITEAGGSLRDIQELAGHSSLATTQRYIQGDTAAKRNVIALI